MGRERSCETVGERVRVGGFQVEGKALRWTNKETMYLESLGFYLKMYVLFLPECKKVEDLLYRVTSLEKFETGLLQPLRIRLIMKNESRGAMPFRTFKVRRRDPEDNL